MATKNRNSADENCPAGEPARIGSEADVKGTGLFRRVFSFQNALLPNDEVETMLDHLAAFIQEAPTIGEMMCRSMGRTFPPADGDYRKLVHELQLYAARQHVEAPPKDDEVIAGLKAFEPVFEFAQKDLSDFDRTDLIGAVRAWVPSSMRHGLGELAKKTEGLEPMIARLQAEAEEREKVDPEDASAIRERISRLSGQYPIGFKPSPSKKGRPRMNLWSKRQLEEMFRDGMPTRRIAKLLGRDEAQVRRLRKDWKARLLESGTVASEKAD
jgi:hypothetical protein